MDRTAPVAHPVAPFVAERWSPRSFSAEPVTEPEARTLFEAARWAPSWGNSQPWRFVYALRDTDPEGHARLAEILNERNRAWAAAAPLLALSIAKERDGEDELRWARHDVGLAVGTLLAQATTMGLHVHQMAGYDHALARTSLELPDDCEPVAMIAIGRAGPADALPEALALREVAERTRAPQEEFAFRGRFGVAAA